MAHRVSIRRAPPARTLDLARDVRTQPRPVVFDLHGGALVPVGEGVTHRLFEPDDGHRGGWSHRELARVIGWAVGTLGRPSLGLAVGLAVGSVALGLVGIWLFARLEGGVLDLPEYFAEVQGPLVLVELAVAGLVAAATVR